MGVEFGLEWLEYLINEALVYFAAPVIEPRTLCICHPSLDLVFCSRVSQSRPGQL